MNKRLAAGDGLFPEPWFGKLLLVSLLVMLNLPAVFTVNTGMDQYGFFTLEPLAEQPWPLVASVFFSTASALAGYGVYGLLRKKQTLYAGNRYGAYQRSAVLFGVPVFLAFAPLFFLTGYNDKPTALAVAGILSTSLCITAALSDRDSRLDPGLARLWFIAGLAFILVFLILCVAAMLVLYLVEQTPSTGNFFWTWQIAWGDLGYPAEEFNQRHRNGLLAFAIAGSCYMTVAIGGSLLGAILGWARPAQNSAPVSVVGDSDSVGEGAAQNQSEPLSDWVQEVQTTVPDAPELVVALNGQEAAIGRSRYENLLADCRLLVDKASGTAFARTGGRWRKLPFLGRRKGPFLLLCVYARHPGRRFTTGELEVLLKSDLSGRDAFNVSDFFAQLQRRNPLVPVRRDDHGTYIPETVKVCFLDHWPVPVAVSEDDLATTSDQVSLARQGT